MSTTTLIDLANLPIPDAVELLDFETIYATRKADFIALYPADEQAEVAATLELESEPIARLLQESSYRELVLRQRVNDAVRAVMLAWAEGKDLDNVAANLNVSRLTVTPGDDTTIPPTAAVMEEDGDLRTRCQLSFQGYSTAGPRGAYMFHALSADGQIKDAYPTSPAPGQIRVYVMSRTGDGTASDDLIAKVKSALNVEAVRPMNDQVDVLSASVVNYQLVAELELFDGPDVQTVVDAANAAAQAYAKSVHYIGLDVALSGYYKALHQAGVSKAEISQPPADILISEGQTAYCTGIVITPRIKANG
ncbi:baseplate J/gp47 family protein [Burkholderia sp. Bp8986]|uniref:baseplate J/gp47 family protein n=1 Tax=Burkholderia sp. Bp8986 TaxID=2184550 RepID=UPI000F592320|nr:baseplate J/gp47 family protein [Burkholderia sp. Bp8986]RQS60415.1 baseplate assembly protein [Burkholderia sp. Bp8986]